MARLTETVLNINSMLWQDSQNRAVFAMAKSSDAALGGLG
jgi:hypothetical protein